MATVIQRSFAGGEIAPALYARVDISKYQTGLRTCRNFFIMRHGGATNRPGTKFVGEVSDSSRQSRLIPFVFSQQQTYILEFGHKYVRFIQNGSYILETAQTITGITQADPAVVTISSHPFSTGDEIYISGVVGMTEVNGRNFKITSLTANTFSLQDMDGNDFDSSALTVYSSGGSAQRVYTVSTVYAEDQLFDFQFIQSADVMTIVHPFYPPKELSRTSATSWTFTDITIDPEISAPTSVGSSGGPAGSKSFTYVVTSVATDTLEESLQSSSTTRSSVDTPTAASPISITWTNASGAQEYNVYKQVNGIYYLLGVSGGSSYSDVGADVDTTITPPIDSDPFEATSNTITGITQADPGVVTYSGTDNYSNGDEIVITGVVGMTEVNSVKYVVANVNTGANTFELTDSDGNDIDTSGFTAYSSAGTVTLIGDYPSSVTYFQQRLTFANTLNNPEKIWTSKIGQFKNFTKSSPIQDDDAISFTIAGRQINEIKHLLDLSQLIVFTESGEWTVGGDDAGILRPTSINPKQQSYNGANKMQPIPIGRSALYVQARGSVVRDLGYDLNVDGYSGNDLTIFSAHLFDDYTLVDWAYQQIPHSTVWVVRDDGSLLCLTYVREQALVAWSRHDWDGGLVESAATVPESNEDVLYVIVKRTINGSTRRFVERMNTRNIVDVVDSTFLDSYLSYDGRNTGSTTMTLSGGTDWVYTEDLTLTASTSYFASTDVGNAIHLTGSDGTVIRCTIKSYSSATVVTVNPNKTVPASMQSTAITSWSRAVDTLTGLWHLEGEDVSVFADGFVVASPKNDSYDTVTVASGSITLDKPYAVIHVGLPYISDVETLDIDALNSETMVDKYKNIQNVTVFVEESRGIWAGPKPPTSDTTDPLENLVEFKLRNEEDYDDPVELKTGSIEVNIQPEWNSNGRVFLRQVDPIPLSVLAIAPAGYLPIRGGG